MADATQPSIGTIVIVREIPGIGKGRFVILVNGTYVRGEFSSLCMRVLDTHRPEYSPEAKHWQLWVGDIIPHEDWTDEEQALVMQLTL